MNDVFMWPERIYPAALLGLLGSGLILSGLRLLPSRHERRAWPDWAFAYLYVFRRVVVGLCIAGAGVAWAEQVTWLLAVSICVGIGESVESSYYIEVLRWGRRRGSLTPG
jgi:hypothetical protein